MCLDDINDYETILHLNMISDQESNALGKAEVK